MQKLIKNKFFIILSIFLIVSFIKTTDVFAVDFFYNDKQYTVADYSNLIDSDKYCIFLNDYGTIYLFNTYQSNSAYIGSKNSFMIRNYKSYFYNLEKKQWFLSKDCTGGTGLEDIAIVQHMFYTSFDIYKATWVSGQGYNLTDEVVFQGAPLTVEQVEIPKIQQVEEIPQAMSKVLEMIIPIGLIVLSIGLLIYLMRLAILRMK